MNYAWLMEMIKNNRIKTNFSSLLRINEAPVEMIETNEQ